jgi:multimeric flavodoxin WrbA
MIPVLSGRGIATEEIWLGTEPVPGCRGCGACRKTQQCVIADVVNETASKLRESDGIVLAAPVHYAGPAAQITCFADRLFYSGMREYRGKVGAAVVSCRRGGASAAFDRLNKYFTISGMHIPGSSYWNAVHGNTPEEVERDLEGLQVMRSLAGNAAYLLQCIAAGRAAGVAEPEWETPARTNFIR